MENKLKIGFNSGLKLGDIVVTNGGGYLLKNEYIFKRGLKSNGESGLE